MGSQDELLIRLLLAVAAVAVVPLALPLLDEPRSRRLPTPVPIVAGLAFAAAMLLGTGPAAAALAVPLAVGAAALGVAELLALARRPSLDRVAVTLAAGWLAAAATVACFALTEPGAPLTPEYLRWPTPAHFLFAGFGLTTLALSADRDRRTVGSRVALLAVLVGMPLLAVQIACFPGTQWTGASIMGTAGLLVAVQQVLVAARSSGVARGMLALSSTALASAMVFAVSYGLATRYAFLAPSLSTMVRIHGVLNSVGFVLLGTIGWRARRRHAPDPASAVLPDALARARDAVDHFRPPLDFDAAPPGYRRGTTRAVVGRGRADYERATLLIGEWAFLPRWMRTYPARAAQEPGRSLVVVADTFGLRWRLPTRILESRADDDGVTNGFVYGALPGHIARGYERFVATFDAATGDVVFDITAVARITQPMLRPVAPLFPVVQWYFRRTAMRRLRSAIAQRPRANPGSLRAYSVEQ